MEIPWSLLRQRATSDGIGKRRRSSKRFQSIWRYFPQQTKGDVGRRVYCPTIGLIFWFIFVLLFGRQEWHGVEVWFWIRGCWFANLSTFDSTPLKVVAQEWLSLQEQFMVISCKKKRAERKSWEEHSSHGFPWGLSIIPPLSLPLEIRLKPYRFSCLKKEGNFVCFNRLSGLMNANKKENDDESEILKVPWRNNEASTVIPYEQCVSSFQLTLSECAVRTRIGS